MKFEQTSLQGVVEVTPDRMGDLRGFFSETWSQRDFMNNGINCEFVQENHSLSRMAGTIRGLHFQMPPKAQAKLVRCGKGRLMDVAVDIRKGSPTYGKYHKVELSFENGKQLFIPEGFLHGFITLEDSTEVVYKCSDFFDLDCDRSVLWSSCAIEWPEISDDPILSGKDRNGLIFKNFDSPFLFVEKC
jgi:dTDP-4-dehydrorhamnose 3,5-epimerase